MKRLKLLIYGLLIMVSCTPQKKLDRLIRRHPHLAVTKFRDIHDTFIRPESKADSLYKLKKKKLTFNIDASFELEYDSLGNLVQDTVELQGKSYKGKVIISSNGNININIEATCETLKHDTLWLKGENFNTRLVIDDSTAKLETVVPADTTVKKSTVPVQEINTSDNWTIDRLLYFFMVMNSIVLVFAFLKLRRKNGQS